MTDNSTSTNVAGVAAETTVTGLTVAVFHKALLRAVPWMCVAAVLIVADLYFGVAAARHRGERVRFSRAIRRTLSKAFEYFCWVSVAAMIEAVFGLTWAHWAILGLVMGIELMSMVSNWLETHGKRLSGVEGVLKGWIKSKAGVDVSEVKIEDIEEENDGNDTDN